MAREEINILQLYNKLCTISRRLPEYDECKKGFDMCLVAFRKGLKDCSSVNHIIEITQLKSRLDQLEWKNRELRDDNRILTNRNNKLIKQHEQISRTKSTG